MPQETTWYIPDAIMLQDFFGEVTAKDVHEAQLTLHSALAAQPNTEIFVLIDGQKISRLCFGLSELKAVPFLTYRDQRGWVVVIADPQNPSSAALKFVMAALSQHFDFRLRLVHSWDEAHAFIGHMNEALRACLPAQ